MMRQSYLPATFLSVALLVGGAASVLHGVPAAKATQPNAISDLGLWLLASDLAKGHRDGQRVNRWPDRSGKEYDAVFEK
jgi:ABC-type uncharacterized transport system permease subunit